MGGAVKAPNAPGSGALKRRKLGMKGKGKHYSRGATGKGGNAGFGAPVNDLAVNSMQVGGDAFMNNSTYVGF